MRRGWGLALAAVLCLGAQAQQVSLVFAGDTTLDDEAGALIERGGDPLAGLASVFAQADIRIANLECVVATTGKAGSKNYTFRAHPRVLPVLRRHLDGGTPDMAFLIGAEAPGALADHAALTDQTDGWATLTLTGPVAVDALMRLVPLDLRLSAFPVGRTTRAPLNHMQMQITRTAPDAFELMVFRSMARTAWHELAEVLEMLHARAEAL